MRCLSLNRVRWAIAACIATGIAVELALAIALGVVAHEPSHDPDDQQQRQLVVNLLIKAMFGVAIGTPALLLAGLILGSFLEPSGAVLADKVDKRVLADQIDYMCTLQPIWTWAA